MYMLDDEGFRSRGGGMFSNIFRMHGGRGRSMGGCGAVVLAVPWRAA